MSGNFIKPVDIFTYRKAAQYNYLSQSGRVVISSAHSKQELTNMNVMRKNNAPGHKRLTQKKNRVSVKDGTQFWRSRSSGENYDKLNFVIDIDNILELRSIQIAALQKIHTPQGFTEEELTLLNKAMFDPDNSNPEYINYTKEIQRIENLFARPGNAPLETGNEKNQLQFSFRDLMNLPMEVRNASINDNYENMQKEFKELSKTVNTLDQSIKGSGNRAGIGNEVMQNVGILGNKLKQLQNVKDSNVEITGDSIMGFTNVLKGYFLESAIAQINNILKTDKLAIHVGDKLWEPNKVGGASKQSWRDGLVFAFENSGQSSTLPWKIRVQTRGTTDIGKKDKEALSEKIIEGKGLQDFLEKINNLEINQVIVLDWENDKELLEQLQKNIMSIQAKSGIGQRPWNNPLHLNINGKKFKEYMHELSKLNKEILNAEINRYFNYDMDINNQLYDILYMWSLSKESSFADIVLKEVGSQIMLCRYGFLPMKDYIIGLMRGMIIIPGINHTYKVSNTGMTFLPTSHVTINNPDKTLAIDLKGYQSFKAAYSKQKDSE